MYGKLKEVYRWPSMTSCGGVIFNKIHFVPIPIEREEEALANNLLILVDDLPIEEKPRMPEPQPAKQSESEQAQDEDVSSRTWTILKRNGLPDIEAVKGFVEAKGADALSEIDGIGKKSLDEILSALEE